MKTSLWCLLLAQSQRAFVAQQVGIHLLQESHPSLKIQTCTSDGACADKRLSITLDADSRPLRMLHGTESCMAEDERAWNATYCANGEQCAEQCSLGGVKYKAVHGITTEGHALKLRLFTHGKLTASRVYLLADEKHYHSFYLKNQQFSFDVDASQLPCGVDAALYFTSMKADGGLSATNKAGAMYGTGYCDAQCPTALRFINGLANVEASGEPGQQPVFKSMGACCPELDLWEGNGIVQAYGAHPCVFPSMATCEGAGCTAGGGLCDHSGCGFASQTAAGDGFYGPNKTIDTRHTFTVVSQFLTATGTAQGELVEIRQFYIQHGVRIPHRVVQLADGHQASSITDQFCRPNASRTGRAFAKTGGIEAMGRALDQGMVLVMGLWTADEPSDSLGSIQKIPATRKPSLRRINQQICPGSARTQPFIQKHHPHASVKFSNIKIGPIHAPHAGIPHRVNSNEHTII
ncbi:hypothetical protein PTTG_06020 [Puccinia triticina 1-1 BBBD Race 1]|uniref:Glucanase n=2 Tax=Puccinia triticina TaxID=208348 RepID=A0A180GDM8_PUCT1|nr:uncharacterized protein PtA15_1A670 [Puccinia triticina]OAV90639.1 hypothetical protein PTTG_06020 [Puccinia triticina 1-1 BBBD Race 1]WAQ81330.1 hypothetical protein PtA15_1A670 [Puccinia triticina]WAR52207.1 hypothetical protein PtB15_1B647 [Puccinia triticina]